MSSLWADAQAGGLRCTGKPRGMPRTSRMRVYCSSKPEVAEPVASTSTSAPAPMAGRNRATFKASKLGRQPILEAQKPLAEYMALPASQYSVLDARRIERVDDSTFRCYVGELRFFSWTVEPVITVSVTVEQGGCTIRLLSCKLQGSRFVEDINDKFSATMTNVVRYQDYVPPAPSDDGDDGDDDSAEEAEAAAGPLHLDSHSNVSPSIPSSRHQQQQQYQQQGLQKEIVSDTSIQVCLEVPPWCSFLPLASIEGVGSGVMQNVLNVMVPRFLAQLRTDYELWASGDQSRRPVGEL